jgi:hypothetical protein
MGQLEVVPTSMLLCASWHENKSGFSKYLVIEVYGNTAKALALIDKRLVKKTQVASHFASKQETHKKSQEQRD